ncbi:MAG: VWA domain-containing protein [Deltaproteobacteria bacterium]|nr:VWA domain-containing protein [Deltaproteobacteria bacterium]
MKYSSLAIVFGAACSAQPKPTLELAIDANQSLIRANQGGIVIARLKVQGHASPAAQPPPVDMALVLDASGSMEGDPITHAKTAARTLLEGLRADDRVAVVSFGSEARLVAPMSEVDAAGGELAQRIETISADGTTDLAAGLTLALTQLKASRRSGAVRRIVLLSDGVPNESSTLAALIEEARGLEISVATMGLGLDTDEVLLSRIALDTHGSFRFVADPVAVATAFTEEVRRAGKTVARSIGGEIRLGPGVFVERAVGISAQPGARTLTLSLGDLSEGESRDVILMLRTPVKPSGSRVELLEARVWSADTDDTHPKAKGYLGLGVTESEEALGASLHPDVVLDAMKAEAAATSISALGLAREGRRDEAQQALINSRAGLQKQLETQAIGANVEAAKIARLELLESALSGSNREARKLANELQQQSVQQLLGH